MGALGAAATGCAGGEAVCFAWRSGQRGREPPAASPLTWRHMVWQADWLAGYGRSTVANAESGRPHPPQDFWKNCDKALGTRDALASGFDEVEALVRRGHKHAAAVAE